MLEKIKNMLYKIKTYWKKPPHGYEVTYKEFVNYALGFGGTSLLNILCMYTGIATTTYMMISHFKISPGVAFVLNIVLGSALGLLRAPILSVIIDNKKDKKGRGKFKQFLILPAVGWAIFFGLIPFIPASWADISLFSVTLPAIPIFGLYEPQSASFSLAIIVAFVMLQLGTFFSTLLSQAMAGIEQTISSVSQERANFISIKGLISNAPGAVINTLLPVVAGILFADSGHQLNINLYRIFFPICMILGVLCILFMYYGVQERVIISQKHQKEKTGLYQGIRDLSQNKYFWIITIFGVFIGLRSAASITNWVCQFSFESSVAKTISNLYCMTLLQSACILGMIAGPMLIKKYGKRNVMIFTSAGVALMTGLQLLVYKNPYLVLFSAFLQNLFGGFGFISTVMASDALDYQQWKTDRRLEGSWQNYSAFIGTIFGIFTGILSPLFLSFAGIGFGDALNSALLNPILRDGAYKYQTLLGFIGSIICLIPLIFYDLTEDKHANYVRVLKIRAASENYNEQMLTDEDYLHVKEVLDYAKENNDEFLSEEIKKHPCLNTIYDGANAVIEKVKLKEKQSDMQIFARDMELEYKRLNDRVEKIKRKAEKFGKPFDETETRKKIASKMRYMRFFSDEALHGYTDFISIGNNLEFVFDRVSALSNSK